MIDPRERKRAELMFLVQPSETTLQRLRDHTTRMAALGEPLARLASELRGELAELDGAIATDDHGRGYVHAGIVASLALAILGRCAVEQVLEEQEQEESHAEPGQ